MWPRTGGRRTGSGWRLRSESAPTARPGHSGAHSDVRASTPANNTSDAREHDGDGAEADEEIVGVAPPTGPADATRKQLHHGDHVRRPTRIRIRGRRPIGGNLEAIIPAPETDGPPDPQPDLGQSRRELAPMALSSDADRARDQAGRKERHDAGEHPPEEPAPPRHRNPFVAGPPTTTASQHSAFALDGPLEATAPPMSRHGSWTAHTLEPPATGEIVTATCESRSLRHRCAAAAATRTTRVPTLDAPPVSRTSPSRSRGPIPQCRRGAHRAAAAG